MKIAGIIERFSNLRQRKSDIKTERKLVSNVLQQGVENARELPVTSAVVKQLASMTFYDYSTSRNKNIYDRKMLKYINKLNQKSPEKAMDMANRLKENVKCSDEYKLPRDWNYLIDIYDNDYQFIAEYFGKDAPLSWIEALHHVKDEIPNEKEFLKYKTISTRLVYPLLEMRKEYPEQVNEILNNYKYKQLFECEKGNVPYSDDMKNFAEFIKEDSETMNKTLDIFKDTNRYHPANSNSPCNLSEALKYAKMMKENPEAATKILKDWPYASPELVAVLMKHSDNPDLYYDFKIYDRFIQPVKMYDNEDSNEWHRTHNFSVPIDNAVLKDIDEFFTSNFLKRFDDLMVEKEKEYINSKDEKMRKLYARRLWEYKLHTDNRIEHKYSLDEVLLSTLECVFEDSTPLRDLFKTDRETFLRLVKDDIVFYKSIWHDIISRFNNNETDTIIKLYKKYPDKEISRDMVNKYAEMDKAVADAFLK